MMNTMAARLFILIALTIHALAGWSAGSLAALADQAGFVQADEDACGGSCCCPPKACPCMHAPEPEDQNPPPAVPPQPKRQEAPKIAQDLRGFTLEPAGDGTGTAITVAGEQTGRPRGDLGRRVQQLQCVWRT